MQGGQFQNCAPFVFAAYTIEMRRKIGGVASRASECKQQCEEDSTETGDVTVEDMTKLIDHLKETDTMIQAPWLLLQSKCCWRG